MLKSNIIINIYIFIRHHLLVSILYNNYYFFYNILISLLLKIYNS